LHELVPPALAWALIVPLNTAVFIFIEDIWSAKIKYTEKGIIVEVVDRCTGWIYSQVDKVQGKGAYLLI